MELPILQRKNLPENAFLVSRSRLGTWHSCQFKHEMTYNSGLPRQARQDDDKRMYAMNFGTAIHRHLEEFYKLWIDSPVGYATPDQLFEISGKILQDAKTPWEKERAMRAGSLLVRYADWAAVQDDFIPLATEIEIFAPTGMTTPKGEPIFLQAIVDLFLELDGVLGFMDHKSGQKFWTQGMIFFDAQIATYFLIFWLNNFDVQFAMVNNINTYPYKDITKPDSEKLFSRVDVDARKFHMEEYFRNVKRTINQLLHLKNPVQNTDKHCEWCRFKDVCEAKFKGIPVGPFLDRLKMDGEDVEFYFDG